MVIKAIRIKSDDEEDDIYSVLYLSIIGLFLFEMLFEARARYLYTYIPLFIMIGSMGMYDLSHFMNQLISKKD